MTLTEYTAEKLVELASDEGLTIQEKVRAILCRIDFDMKRVNGGLLDQHQSAQVDYYMEGYCRGRAEQKACQ